MFSNGQQVKKERKREVHKIEYFKNEKNISAKKSIFQFSCYLLVKCIKIDGINFKNCIYGPKWI